MKNKNTSYDISDISYSIKDNGEFAGTPMMFIRFHGCNLSCEFCEVADTYKEHRIISSKNIVKVIGDYIKKENIRGDIKICFTGGEPFLQLNDDLVSSLMEAGFYDFFIETNGSLEVPDGMYRHMFYIEVSPKTQNFNWKIADAINFLYPGVFPDDEILRYADFEGTVFIQPVIDSNYENNLRRCIEFVSNNANYRLSVPVNKYIGLP